MNKNRLFIASPISGFENIAEYNVFRNKLLQAIKKLLKLNHVEEIRCELMNVKNVSDYDSPYVSAQKDFLGISNASHFIFVYPQKTITSAFIELGYAIALKKKILIITTNRRLLPYMAQELDAVYSNIEICFLDEVDVYTVIKDFISK